MKSLPEIVKENAIPDDHEHLSPISGEAAINYFAGLGDGLFKEQPSVDFDAALAVLHQIVQHWRRGGGAGNVQCCAKGCPHGYHDATDCPRCRGRPVAAECPHGLFVLSDCPECDQECEDAE